MATTKVYYAYITTNGTRTLYVGVTNNLERRVLQHKLKLLPGFTPKYNLDRWVYYEAFGDIRNAIAREKQIKGWLRAKKVALIVAKNPAWQDLSADWYSRTNLRLRPQEKRTDEEVLRAGQSEPNEKDPSLRSGDSGVRFRPTYFTI